MKRELLEKQTTVSDICVSLLEFTKTKAYIDGVISEIDLDRDLPKDIQYEIRLTDQIGAYTFFDDTPKIVLTKGLLEFVTRGELMAVLGHEASHILHHDLGLRIEENSCDLHSVERLIAHQVSPETMISFFRRMSKKTDYDPKTFHINEMLHDEHSPFEQRIRNVQMYMANINKYGEVQGLTLHSTSISSEIKEELEETVQRYLDQLPAEEPILPEQTVKDDPIARLHTKLISLVKTQASQSDFRKLCEQLRELKIDSYDIESFNKMNSLVDYAYHRLPEKVFIDIYRAAGFAVVPLHDEWHITLTTEGAGYSFREESRKQQSDTHLPAFSVFQQLQQSIIKFAKAESFAETFLIAIEINHLIAETSQLIPLFKQAGAIVEIAFDQCDYLYGLQRSMNKADMISDLHKDTSGQIVLMLWHLGFFKPPKEYDYLASLNKLGFYKEVENYVLDNAGRAEFEMLIWDKMYEHHPDLIQRVITDPHHELFGVMLSDRIILGAERNKERPIRKKFSPELSHILREQQVADILENKEKYRQTLLNTDFSNESQRNDFLQRYGDVFHIVQVGDYFENIENQAIQVTLDIFRKMLEAGNPQHVRSVVAFFQHLHSIVNYHAGAALSHTSSYAQFVVRHKQYFLRDVVKTKGETWTIQTIYPNNKPVLFNILFGNDEPVSLFLKDEQTISFLALAGVNSIDSMEALDKVVNFLEHDFRGVADHFTDLVANEVEKSLPAYPFPARPGSNRDYGYELINFASRFFSQHWTRHVRRYNILAEKIAWRTDDKSLYSHFTTDELSRIYIQFDLSSAFKSTEAKAFLEVLLLHRLSKPCNSPKEMLLQQIVLHNLLIMTYFSHYSRMVYSVSDIQLRKRLINIWAENTRQFIAFIQSKKHEITLSPSYHNPAAPKKFLSAFGFSDHEIIELMKSNRWKMFHEICRLYENSNTIIDYIFEYKSIQDQFLLLDILSEALQLQRESLQKIKEKFDANLQRATDSTRRETAIAHEMMNASVDSILKLLSEDDELRLSTIQYLIEPVTFASARRMRDKLKQSLSPDQYIMLTRALGIGFGVYNPSAYENNLIATNLFHFHREFHELSIEHKALGMANLLIPTKAVLTSEDQAAAFSQALALVLDHLFPADDSNMDPEERQMACSFVKAYIEESPKYTDEFILAGLLAASHDNSQIGGKIHIGQIIASICEHMGPAYVKLAQALHSHPATPEFIKKDLKHVKANVRMPYRWEIAGKIQALRIKAQHIGRRLGAASYNIAVEITVDNKIVVLLLRHDEVIKQASYGFDHLRRTISRWDHPAVEQMRDTLLNIISHTECALEQETDNEKLKQLERNAEQIYGNLTITVDNTQLQVRPMRTLVWEEKYRLLEQAQGVHFNDLPMDSPLRNAVAKAILVLELSNIFSGSQFDSDRHGSQLRVDDHSIGLFDFGEMMPDTPTATDVTQLQRALPYMIGDAFAPMSNLQLPTFQDYLKQLDENNQPLSSFVTRAYRALLALQDYMTGLSMSDFLEVLTAIQKVKFLNQYLLQTLQYTVRTTADKIYQAKDPTTWVAAYKLITSTLASTQANIKMSRPESTNAVTLWDDHPFDTLIRDQLPTWDGYTKQPMFSAEAYKKGVSVGRFTLFGTVELCREKDGSRTNIVKTSGVFDELVAKVNVDELQTCDVMPLTSYEIIKHELQQGAIMGCLRGISKVTEWRLASEIAPMRAKVAGKLMLYSLYFNWAYSAYLLEQKEHDYGWLTLLQASMDTATMAALDLGLDVGSKLCALVSDKAKAANYITASKIIRLVGDNLGVGLGAYTATQKSLVSVGASIAGGFFAEKAICLTASYAGVKPQPA